MELRKIAFKRSVKLLTLLLTSMLIATASAAVYNYMYMESFGIGVEAAKVRFTSTGMADFSAADGSIGINGTYVKFTSMMGWPNATRVYEQAVGIENTEATDRNNVELEYVSWSSSNNTAVEYIYVKVFDGATLKGSTLDVKAGGSTGTFTLTGLATYRVQWEIKWDAYAKATDTASVTLQLIVPGE